MFANLHRRKERGARRAQKKGSRRTLQVEPLEVRTMLSVSASALDPGFGDDGPASDTDISATLAYQPTLLSASAKPDKPGNGGGGGGGGGGGNQEPDPFNIEWVLGVNADSVRNAVVAADQSIYVVGTFQDTVDFDPNSTNTAVESTLTSVGERDFFVAHYDADGNFLEAWPTGEAASMLQSEFNEIGSDIALDAAGNVYVAFNWSAVKFSPVGEVLWHTKVGGFAEDLVVDDAGHVFLSGTFSGTVDFDADPDAETSLTSTGLTDIYVVKLDADDGSFEWVASKGSSSSDDARGLEYHDGGVLVTGQLFDDATGEGNAFVWKLDAAAHSAEGADTWTATTQNDFAYGYPIGSGVTVDDAGNIWTTGIFAGITNFGSGTTLESNSNGGDVFIWKLDPTGTQTLWAGGVGRSGAATWAFSIATDGQDVYVGGTFYGRTDFDPGPGTYYLGSRAAYPDRTAFVLKLDNQGNFVWVTDFPGERATGLAVDRVDGSVYATGDLILANGSADIAKISQATFSSTSSISLSSESIDGSSSVASPSNVLRVAAQSSVTTSPVVDSPKPQCTVSPIDYWSVDKEVETLLDERNEPATSQASDAVVFDDLFADFDKLLDDLTAC